MGDSFAAAAEQGEAGRRALIDQAPDAIFIADPSGRYTFANEAACRLLGYARDELIGKTILELIPAEDVNRLLRSREKMLRGRSHAAEWRLRRKDGTWAPVEVHANILPGGQWQGFARDISERKALEAEREALFKRIDAKRRWLQAVLDTVPLGVLLFEPDGRLSFNHRSEELLGMRLSPSGGYAQYASRILFPDGTPVPPERLVAARVLRGETIVAEEFRVARADGSRIPVLTSGAPIRDEQGAVRAASECSRT